MMINYGQKRPKREKLIFRVSPVIREWVEEIGGDGFASTAAEGVKLVQSLLGIS